MNWDEIKEKINILDVVQKYVKLKRVGRYYSGLCPFHKETKPSFYVSSEMQIFKCFGCGEGGDVIKFLMKIENLDFKGVLEKLKEDYGIEIESKKEDRDSNKKILEVNYAALKFFRNKLKENKEAIEYLKKRGVSDESINYFEIGFSPGNTLLRDYLFSLGYSKEILENAGLLDPKNFDRFQSRIIFPLRDEKGRLVGFMGRIFPETHPGPKYLNTPDTPLFKKSKFLYGLYYSKDYILKEKKVVITEGNFDFILSFQNGLKNIVCVSGSALTNDHLNILKRYSKEIVLAFDNDSAGFNSTLKVSLMAKSFGFNIKKLIYIGKDLAEFFKNGYSINEIIEVDFYDWLFEYLFKNNFDKYSILEIFLPQIKLLDLIKINEYLDIIEKKLDLPKEFLIKKLEETKIEIPTVSVKEDFKEKIVKKDLGEILSLKVLSLLYIEKDESLIEEITDVIKPEFQELLHRIIKNNLEKNEIEFFEMAKTYFTETKINFEKELTKSIKILKKYNLKRKLYDLQKDLKILENNNDIISTINEIIKELKKLN